MSDTTREALERMLTLKQNDWIEACGEIDKLKEKLTESEKGFKQLVAINKEESHHFDVLKDDWMTAQNHIKELQAELALKDSWVKHHQGSVEATMKRCHKAEYNLKLAMELIDMVEDNSKMPHQHTDPQTRLYCLTERAVELRDKLSR